VKLIEYEKLKASTPYRSIMSMPLLSGKQRFINQHLSLFYKLIMCLLLK